MPQARFLSSNSKHCGFIRPIFDQCEPLHEKCNVYVRFCEGEFPTHRLNLIRWPIFPFAQVHITSAVGIFRTQLKSTLWSLFEAMSEIHTEKNLLSPIFTIATPRQKAAIPRSEGKRVGLVNFIVSLVSITVIRSFISIIVHAIYPLIRSKWVWVTSCNTIMLVSCLWRNLASAFSLSLICHRRWGSLFDKFRPVD